MLFMPILLHCHIHRMVFKHSGNFPVSRVNMRILSGKRPSHSFRSSFGRCRHDTWMRFPSMTAHTPDFNPGTYFEIGPANSLHWWREGIPDQQACPEFKRIQVRPLQCPATTLLPHARLSDHSASFVTLRSCSVCSRWDCRHSGPEAN